MAYRRSASRVRTTRMRSYRRRPYRSRVRRATAYKGKRVARRRTRYVRRRSSRFTRPVARVSGRVQNALRSIRQSDARLPNGTTKLSTTFICNVTPTSRVVPNVNTYPYLPADEYFSTTDPATLSTAVGFRNGGLLGLDIQQRMYPWPFIGKIKQGIASGERTGDSIFVRHVDLRMEMEWRPFSHDADGPDIPAGFDVSYPSVTLLVLKRTTRDLTNNHDSWGHPYIQNPSDSQLPVDNTFVTPPVTKIDLLGMVFGDNKYDLLRLQPDAPYSVVQAKTFRQTPPIGPVVGPPPRRTLVSSIRVPMNKTVRFNQLGFPICDYAFCYAVGGVTGTASKAGVRVAVSTDLTAVFNP